jgi:hypothetical protein
MGLRIELIIETQREKQSETDFQKNGRCDIGAAQSDGCARHS